MIMAFNSEDITDALSCNLSPKAILWVGTTAPLATSSFIFDPSAEICIKNSELVFICDCIKLGNFFLYKSNGVKFFSPQSVFIMGIDQLHGGGWGVQ